MYRGSAVEVVQPLLMKHTATSGLRRIAAVTNAPCSRDCFGKCSTIQPKRVSFWVGLRGETSCFGVEACTHGSDNLIAAQELHVLPKRTSLTGETIVARIKIDDLQPLEELTDDQLGDVVGGITRFGSIAYDAWMPSSITAYDAWMPSKIAAYDAWVPPRLF
jgi:hypothetical protein